MPLALPLVAHAGWLFMFGDGAAPTQVYESTDGKSWRRYEHNARWGARYRSAYASYRGALWRVGGFVPVIYRAGRVLPRLLVLPRLAGSSKWFPLTLSSVIVASGLAALAIASLLPWWVALALAWLFAASPPVSLPWIPWSIRMRVGEPIPAAELFPDATDATLARAYQRVQGAVQALVAPSPRGGARGPGR